MAIDYFLNVEGIPGDSAARGFEAQIEVTTWTWRLDLDFATTPAEGAPIPLLVRALDVAKRVDRASPKLMAACASRQVLPRAVLSCVQAGGQQRTLLRATMTDLYISYYAARGTADPDAAMLEDFGITFGTIELEFTELRMDGSAAGVIRAGWDVRSDQPC